MKRGMKRGLMSLACLFAILLSSCTATPQEQVALVTAPTSPTSAPDVPATPTAAPTTTTIPTDTPLPPTATSTYPPTPTATRTATFTPMPTKTVTPTVAPTSSPRPTATKEILYAQIQVWHGDFDNGIMKSENNGSTRPGNDIYTGGTFVMSPEDIHPWSEPIFDSRGLKIGDESVSARYVIASDPLGQRGLVLQTTLKKHTGVLTDYGTSKQEVYRAYPEVGRLGIQGAYQASVDVLIPDQPFVGRIEETADYSRWLNLLSVFSSKQYSGGANLKPLPNGNFTVGLYIPGKFWREEVLDPTAKFEIGQWNNVMIRVDSRRMMTLFLNGKPIRQGLMQSGDPLELQFVHAGLYCGPLPEGTTVYNDRMVISQLVQAK